MWLAEAGGAHSLRVTGEGAVASGSVTASNVVIGGRDLAGRVASIPLTPGVAPGRVRGEHVLPGSLETDKMGGVLSGAAGGTGGEGLQAGGVLSVAPGGGLRGAPGLSLSPGDGGLVVQGGLSVGPGAGFDPPGVFRSGSGSERAVRALRAGMPPSVDGAARAGPSVEWEASSPEGGLRRVAVRYAAPGSTLTAEDVLSEPDDWYEADEGAATQVFVGDGPSHRLSRDRAGSLRWPAVLVAGRSYRFEPAEGASGSHPFWVGDGPSSDFGGFPVEGTPGLGRASGLASQGDFLQFAVPRGYGGGARHFSTSGGAEPSSFEVRPGTPPLAGSPLASLAGAFDGAGRESLDAHLVAEDAMGNASAVAVAPAAGPG